MNLLTTAAPGQPAGRKKTARLASTTTTEGTAWRLDRRGRWSPAADPTVNWCGTDAERMQQAERDGWSWFLPLGSSCGPLEITLYQGKGGLFLAAMVLYELDFVVILADLPSLWMLLHQAGPLLAEARAFEKELAEYRRKRP
jgi:hypothetical protein